MKPDDRPISFTIPIPLGKLHLASVFADIIAACAASTDVVKPNDLSIKSTSLSIVFGIPTTAIFNFLLTTSCDIR